MAHDYIDEKQITTIVLVRRRTNLCNQVLSVTLNKKELYFSTSRKEEAGNICLR